MSKLGIDPYTPDLRDDVLALVRRAWRPVFDRTSREVPRFVFDNFYPSGWETRQDADVARLLDDGDTDVWLAKHSGILAGLLGLRLHPEDRMGEVQIIAVDPKFQHQGIGAALMQFAEDRIKAAGMAMIMVETVDDTGHAPARALYENKGYERWPVARYFKKL